MRRSFLIDSLISDSERLGYIHLSLGDGNGPVRLLQKNQRFSVIAM
jgi:hypothetical protein